MSVSSRHAAAARAPVICSSVIIALFYVASSLFIYYPYLMYMVYNESSQNKKRIQNFKISLKDFYLALAINE